MVEELQGEYEEVRPYAKVGTVVQVTVDHSRSPVPGSGGNGEGERKPRGPDRVGVLLPLPFFFVDPSFRCPVSTLSVQR